VERGRKESTDTAVVKIMNGAACLGLQRRMVEAYQPCEKVEAEQDAGDLRDRRSEQAREERKEDDEALLCKNQDIICLLSPCPAHVTSCHGGLIVSVSPLRGCTYVVGVAEKRSRHS
jgi:hypothetical protein